MSVKFSELSYEILAGRSPFYQNEASARNEIFRAWLQLWSEVYKNADAGFKLKPEEFLRQHLVTCIRHKGKPAAIHLYTFFDLSCEASLSSHYFEFFNPMYLNTIKDRGARVAMSMEYYTVLPEFRKSEVGLSLGSTILQLGTWLFNSTHADVIVAPARKDVKADRAAYDVGFECIQANTIQRGFPCDLVALFHNGQKDSADESVVELSKALWSSVKIFQSAEDFLIAHRRNNQLSWKKAA